MPWTELGAALVLAGSLTLMGNAPVPLITPEDVESFEGRTIRIAGFAEDVQVGVDSHRGVLVANGFGIRFQAEGLGSPTDGAWVELRGTLHRNDGRLVLFVEAPAWTS